MLRLMRFWFGFLCFLGLVLWAMGDAPPPLP